MGTLRGDKIRVNWIVRGMSKEEKDRARLRIKSELELNGKTVNKELLEYVSKLLKE